MKGLALSHQYSHIDLLYVQDFSIFLQEPPVYGS